MRKIGQDSRGRRRGFVFSIRVTEQEHQALAVLQASVGGPRALGPWLLWRALEGEPGDRAGITSAPRPGTTPPARYYRRALEQVLPPDQEPADVGVLPGPGSTRSSKAPSSGSTSASCSGSTSAAVVPELGALERVVPPPAARTILDLCGGSGAWALPYERAGYRVERVTLPERDVRTYVPPPDVWGVLAAPPCTQFSLARNGHPELARDFVEGMACVNACLRIVAQCRPRWWALENPVGHLSKFLGIPRDTWEPCDFGDPWTKATSIWGEYSIPKRGPFVEPRGGGPLCEECDPEGRRTTWCNSPAHRARTPQGFARAFFEANP